MLRLTFLILISFSFSYAQNFRFVVWGDSQFQNPEVFEETVRKTELLNPSFVIHVGDMIHGYTYSIENARRQWKRFIKQITPLTSPFYPTPGNHDVTTKESQPAYTETWGDDKLFYSFSYENSYFIILNTYLDQKFDSIPDVELEWLKQELEKAKGKENIFISMHSPLYLNNNYNWEAIHDIFKQYPVKAVFTGHYHSYDYRVIDDISYFCLNSSGNMSIYNEQAGRSHNFLMVTVKDSLTNFTVFTRDNIYPPDFVLPGESARAAILEGDKTIIINSPAKGIDTTVYIAIKNMTDSVRNYTIKPVIKDFTWKFEPAGYNVKLNPGITDSVFFHIKYTGDEVSRNKMPGILVSTEYFTLKGEQHKHKYNYHLFNPPFTTASETDDNIIVDGMDKEHAWHNTSAISELYTDTEGRTSSEKTYVKVLYDEDNIYVFVRGEEPNPDGLSSAAYGDIPLVFGDDDFELYFDTNRDLKTFYRLMVNPAGTILSSGPKGRFTFNFEVKTFIGKDFWSAEFKIPLSEINIKENLKGKIWGFNVRRHRQQAEDVQSDWSKMNTYPPYQPEYFGLLRFEWTTLLLD